jgi:hypothetical protein
MKNINDRWSALSMKDRAALIDIYIKSGITDLGEMRKSYNGIPYRDLNTSEYDYFNAAPEMAPTKEGQHWDSRNPYTGRLLKREDHPTFDLTVEGEKQAGYKIIRGYNGELYSIPNEPTNYVEEHNSFGDGGDTNNPLLSREEYLNNKRQKIIDASLSNSRNRTEPVSPLIPMFENEEEWRAITTKELETINSKLSDSKFWFDNPSLLYQKKDLSNRKKILEEELSKPYTTKCYKGASCIYTATDNYGKKYRAASNYQMHQNPEKYGFIRIDPNSAKPGDILQIGLDHAITYDHMGDDGYIIYNQSGGGDTKESIGVGRRAANKGFDNFSNAYRFIGLQEDNDKWNSEYNKYRQNYSKNIIEELKNVPIIELPKTVNTFKTGGPTENTKIDTNWKSDYKDLPQGYKQAVLKIVTDLNLNSEDAESLYNSGKLKAVIEAKYQNTPSGRVRQNDSPTSTESSNLEKKMNKMLYNSTDRVLPNMKYAIPYIKELEVKVPGVGRTTTNALDSLAKYAVQAQIPLSEALGLSAQETAFGALPQYNYVEIVGTEEEKQKARDFNRALGNSSYFRNYGIIPAENFVRDFRYNIVEDPIDRDVPPLLHAFNYWKKGNYNRGDSDHTKDVKAKGEAVMKTKVIQDWINNSKFAQKALNLSK